MIFNDDMVQQVWNKGRVVPGYDPNIWRKDQCGAWIGKQFYGNRGSQYGWEIDHITPSEDGGTNDLSNLRPLQWENNANRQSGRLDCPIIAEGVNNIRR
jgi:hypothetical protein